MANPQEGQIARQSENPAPEVDNSEQDGDAAEQAQTIAEEARNRAGDRFEDSEKVPTGSDSDDVQDLVDHMNQMESSGTIDMDAYRGEPNHDDNVDKYGPRSKLGDLKGDGS